LHVLKENQNFPLINISMQHKSRKNRDENRIPAAGGKSPLKGPPRGRGDDAKRGDAPRGRSKFVREDAPRGRGNDTKRGDAPRGRSNCKGRYAPRQN
jgi:hypothetical protein